MATAPTYAATPKVSAVKLTTGNTAIDGSGTLSLLWTAGASGSRVERIVITSPATTVSGMIRLFLSSNVITSNTVSHLIKEVYVGAKTPGVSVPAFSKVLDAVEVPSEFPIIVPTGYFLHATTHVTGDFRIVATGADF